MSEIAKDLNARLFIQQVYEALEDSCFVDSEKVDELKCIARAWKRMDDMLDTKERGEDG